MSNDSSTNASPQVIVSHGWRKVSWMLQIPDGLDTTVKYSADKLKKDYELYDEPELSIDEMDGKFVLIWSAYTKNQTRIIVDAKSGELLEEYSTTIID